MSPPKSTAYHTFQTLYPKSLQLLDRLLTNASVSPYIGGQCNIMMSSQLTSLLRHYCENIINGLPHSSAQLQRIIQLFSTSSLLDDIILKLIALFLRINYSEVQDQAKKVGVVNYVIANILQFVVPMVNGGPPLKFLMARNFTKFSLFCQQQIYDKDFKELSFRTQGLFPINDANGIGSIFSFHSEKRQPFEGNPNWLFSRYLLANWYKINKEQMSMQVQQVYSFLLSEAQFCSGANSLKKLWAILYAFYTQSVLEQDLPRDVPFDSRYITWKRFEQNQFVEQILAIQGSLPQEHKVLYNLVCCLLDQLKMGTNKGIKEVYQLLAQHCFQNQQLKPFINVLFLQLSKTIKNTQLEQLIKTQGRKLVEQQSTNKAIYFPLFFNPKELVSKILELQVNFLEIPLKYEQKCELAAQLYNSQKITSYYLQYLSNQHFLQMFSSNKWKDQSYAQFILSLMTGNNTIFIEKLMNLAQETEANLALKQFQLFFNAWKNCYQSISSSLELSALDTAASLRKDEIRKKYQFMVIPRQFPEVVLKILLAYSRFFSSKKGEAKGNGKFQKLLKQFQATWLPELIELLSEEQRSQFWKEWISVVNGDREFVEEILRAADPLVDN